jgi:septum site-determining protein MinD
MSTVATTRDAEPRSIAILSGKGGTGKSIIAASIGCLLARCGFKTMLVDVDLFTGGLTFYSLAAYPRTVSHALQELFLGSRSEEDTERTEVSDELFPQTVAIPNTFARGNLFLLPAHSSKVRPKSELALNARFRGVSSFSRTLTRCLQSSAYSNFDYILLDTRGGTDVTSVGGALVAGSFILVTEADKTSWDVGSVLLNTVSEQSHKTGIPSEMLGFIINKNVLPPEAIVTFLRQRWSAPNLATIPLDGDAIRCYQEDKIPVAEDIGSLFSIALIPVIRKLFVSDKWSRDALTELERIEKQASNAEASRLTTQSTAIRAERLSVLLKIYGTAISTFLLVFLAVNSLFIHGGPNIVQIVTIVTAAVLIFVMTGSDPKVVQTLIQSLFHTSSQKTNSLPSQQPEPAAQVPIKLSLEEAPVKKNKRPASRKPS